MLRIELPGALKAHKAGWSPGKGIADWGGGSGPRVAALCKISLGDSGLEGGWCTASQQQAALLPVAPRACKLEGSFAWRGCLVQGRKRFVPETRSL